MMKSFMILGTLIRGTELDENPGRSNMMPFPGEDTVMTVYGGCPGSPTHCGWGHEDTRV
jgi:hypothetical protein